MNLGIGGKVALIFGAGGGLGGAIARAIAAEGAKVALADLDPSAAQASADAINHSGGSAQAFKWDLADIEGITSRLTRLNRPLAPSTSW